MYYHIRITSKSDKKHDEAKVDLTEEQLLNNFITPYNNGHSIVINGKTIPPEDLERIKISRSADNSKTIVAHLKVEDHHSSVIVIGGHSYEWRAADRAEDITDCYITSPPGFKTDKKTAKTQEGNISEYNTNRIKVFISHSEKDSKIAEFFLEDILIGALNVKHGDIFCTSAEGHRIRSGEDWRKELKAQLGQSAIVFLLITTNYKSSEICLNEMGAAWALCENVIPTVIDPVNFTNVGVLNEVRQIEVINKEPGLARIKDKVLPILNTPAEEIKTDKWIKKSKDFILKVNDHIDNNPFPLPRTEKDIKELEDNFHRSLEELNSCVENNKSLNKALKELSVLKEKSQEEINKILVKNKIETEYAIFKKHVKQVKSLLNRFKRPIKECIFADFTGKPFPVDWDNDRPVIQDADARNYLSVDEDSNISIKWGSKTLAQLWDSLTHLQTFINKKHSDTFDRTYANEYDASLDINDLTFWEEVLM